MRRIKKRYIVNFPGHLANCEFNYRRLKKLMPGWPEARRQATMNNSGKNSCWHYIVGDESSNEIAIMIQVSEWAKYTTTINILVQPRLHNQVAWVKYLKGCGAHGIAAEKGEHPVENNSMSMLLSGGLKPYSFSVRLYHDAIVAEVVSWEGRRRFKSRHAYPNRYMYHRDEKSQLNRFLGELLEFCLVQGRVMHDIVTVP